MGSVAITTPVRQKGPPPAVISTKLRELFYRTEWRKQINKGEAGAMTSNFKKRCLSDHNFLSTWIFILIFNISEVWVQRIAKYCFLMHQWTHWTEINRLFSDGWFINRCILCTRWYINRGLKRVIKGHFLSTPTNFFQVIWDKFFLSQLWLYSASRLSQISNNSLTRFWNWEWLPKSRATPPLGM